MLAIVIPRNNATNRTLKIPEFLTWLYFVDDLVTFCAFLRGPMLLELRRASTVITDHGGNRLCRAYVGTFRII